MSLMDRLFTGKIIFEIELSRKSLFFLGRQKASLIFSIKNSGPKIYLKTSTWMLLGGGVNYSEIDFDNLEKITKAFALIYGINQEHDLNSLSKQEILKLFENKMSG